MSSPYSVSTKKLITGGSVLTLDKDGSIFDNHDILIDGNKIEKIAPNINRDGITQIIDARNKLVMPGLINAHLHSYENLFRGLTRNLPNELWNLYVYPPIGSLKFPPRLYYLRAILGGMEMLKKGVTTIQDNSSGWFAVGDRIVEDAYWNAYSDLGVRASVAVGLIDRSWLDSIPGLKSLLPENLISTLSDYSTHLWTPKEAVAVIDHCEKVIRERHNPSGRLTVAIAPSAPQRCSSQLLEMSMDLAEKYDLGFQSHVLETRIQSRSGEFFYGTSIIKYLDELGLLQPRTSLVHAVWVTDADIQLLARSNCSVIHCPTSNLRLGSGVMPYKKLKAADIPIGLGADGAASSDSQSMFDIMYVAGLIHSANDPDYSTWPLSEDILRMATTNNARCIWRQNELGCLAPGMLADIILLDMKHISFTPLHNIYNQLVFSKPEGAVTMVLVDGEIVVENGRLINVNEEDLLDEVREYQEYIKSQILEAQGESLMLLPFIDQLYKTSIGSERR